MVLKEVFIPSLVTIVILVFGWGNLFIFAIKTRTLGRFLRHPAFMIGDLVILPSIGFLVTWFFLQIASWGVIVQIKWIYVAVLAIASLFVSLFSGYRSLVKRTAPLHPLIVPHFFFYWFMAFMLMNFFLVGTLQLLINGWDIFLLTIYTTVASGITIHFILPIVFGQKTFTVK